MAYPQPRVALPALEANGAMPITSRCKMDFCDYLYGASDFCFQSACYFSRGLIASDFGFNLPDNAEIKGIQLNVLRKANTAQSVKDYSVRLMKETEPVGNDKNRRHSGLLSPVLKSMAETPIYGELPGRLLKSMIRILVA